MEKIEIVYPERMTETIKNLEKFIHLAEHGDEKERRYARKALNFAYLYGAPLRRL